MSIPDDPLFALAASLLPPAYVRQAAEERRRRQGRVRLLLSSHSLPESPWPSEAIEELLVQLSSMDSNNFGSHVGAGEREGRVFSDLVRRRHWGMAHGVGRSGDIAAVQPKAAGSSLLYQLTNRMALHAVRVCGIARAEAALVLPTATGMSLTLVLLTLLQGKTGVVPPATRSHDGHSVASSSAAHSQSHAPRARTRTTSSLSTSTSTAVLNSSPRHLTSECVAGSVDGDASAPPTSEAFSAPTAAIALRGSGARSPSSAPTLSLSAADASSVPSSPHTPVVPVNSSGEVFRRGRYVIWSRIDQKSCFKCITAAGCQPLVVELLQEGDELVTDVAGIAAAISCVGAAAVVAVLTTTSCFAPRAMDDVVAVAQLCRDSGVAHVINNAYGLQSSKICHEINEAIRLGRVDAFVQSTDKNFMVPVGGAIVASPSKTFADAVSALYPGRASSGPIVDLFITFLAMGVSGWRSLLAQRKDVAVYLRDRICEVAASNGERVLLSRGNPISFAMTVDNVVAALHSHDDDAPTGAESLSGAAAGVAVGSSPLCGLAAPMTQLPAPLTSEGSATPQIAKGQDGVTFLGSMLFSRGVSGTRVVNPAEVKTIDGVTFHSYGSSKAGYPHAYLTAAAAIGMTRGDVDLYVSRLDKTLKELVRKRRGK